MKKFVVIAVAILVAAGLALNIGVTDEPAVVGTVQSAPAADDGGLADLGPVELVTASYMVTFDVACIDLGVSSIYFTSFTAADIGSSSTITSVAAMQGSAALAGGTVAVLGSTDPGCTPGMVVDTVTGTFADSDYFVVTLRIVTPPVM